MAAQSGKTSDTGELIEIFSRNVDVVDELLVEIDTLNTKAKRTKREELLLERLLKITRQVLDNNKSLQQVIENLQKDGR